MKFFELMIIRCWPWFAYRFTPIPSSDNDSKEVIVVVLIWLIFLTFVLWWPSVVEQENLYDSRWTDKEGIWWQLKDNFRQFSIKTYVLGTHQNRLGLHKNMLWVLLRIDSDEHQQHMFLWRTEAILMSTHNKCFYGELSKIIP